MLPDFLNTPTPEELQRRLKGCNDEQCLMETVRQYHQEGIEDLQSKINRLQQNIKAVERDKNEMSRMR